jgi:hypothetical protein
MNILLDILGGTFIGGILLLLIIKLNIFTANASYYSDNELRLQQNAKTLAEIINYDLRKIGYNYEGVSIITADSTRIKFYADMNEPGTPGYGTVDVVEYYLKDSTSSLGTSNPSDRVLCRIINEVDTISGPSLGLVKLNFSYLNAQNIETTILEDIVYVKAEFWVEPVEIMNNFITGQRDSSVFTYWELTINPRNI